MRELIGLLTFVSVASVVVYFSLMLYRELTSSGEDELEFAVVDFDGAEDGDVSMVAQEGKHGETRILVRPSQFQMAAAIGMALVFGLTVWWALPKFVGEMDPRNPFRPLAVFDGSVDDLNTQMTVFVENDKYGFVSVESDRNELSLVAGKRRYTPDSSVVFMMAIMSSENVSKEVDTFQKIAVEKGMDVDRVDISECDSEDGDCCVDGECATVYGIKTSREFVDLVSETQNRVLGDHVALSASYTFSSFSPESGGADE